MSESPPLHLPGHKTKKTTWWDHIVGVMMLSAMLPSWLGLAGGLHWALDLMSHFRWQYLFVGLLVIPWLLWRRQRMVLTITAATVLLNAVLIGRLALPPALGRIGMEEGASLRFLSMNVLTSNPHKQAVIDHVMSSDADVVFFMEVNDTWAEALQSLKLKYPHHMAQPRPDNFGIALFSRIPWTREKILWLGAADVPSIEVHFSHAGRGFTFIGTHPLPPMGAVYASLRDQQLRALADRTTALPEPVLVMGDLNTSPWSAGMRILTASGRPGFRSLSPPWAATWRVGSVLAIAIDHALCTAPLVITERSIGRDVGSDHRPLHIMLGFEK